MLPLIKLLLLKKQFNSNADNNGHENLPNMAIIFTFLNQKLVRKLVK